MDVDDGQVQREQRRELQQVAEAHGGHLRGDDGDADGAGEVGGDGTVNEVASGLIGT